MTRYGWWLSAVLVIAVGCPADDGDERGNDGLSSAGSDGMSSGGEDEGSTTGDTEETGATGGDDDTTTGAGVVCPLADTEEECANAVSGSDEGCVWFPHYTVTTNDGTVCAFEPAGGSCSPPIMGDTDCGTHSAPCDFEIHAQPGDADGVFTITRNDDGCSYLPNLPRVSCDDLMAGGEPGFDDFACGCGCAPNYPE